jgi:two-component system, sensor histidine kinase and response regulator
MSAVDLRPAVLAEAAHELRAPLGGIEAMAQLLGETDLSPEQRRLVAGLQAAAAHLRSVAGDIIDTARGQKAADKGTVAQAFSLQALLEAVSASADARARAMGLRFVAEIAPEAPDQVTGDPRRIRQMLENLIDNAVKVTDAGEIRLTVSKVDQRGAFAGLIFSVKDTGPGIRAEDRERLFRTFSRIDNGVPGSGLGLSLVARMARAMGGDAGCAADAGEGAVFWFSLRLKIAGPEAAPTDVPAQSALQKNCGPVLVVDDNQANRMIMTAILEHFGYAVAEAQTGEEALEKVRAMPILAVMLDQTLPGICGLETLAAIRAMDGEAGSLPVIPVTGRVSPEDKAAFAAAGGNGFVEKPVNARAVRDALEAALAAPRGLLSAA